MCAEEQPQTRKVLKHWERPHYYHVICQDLIKEKLQLTHHDSFTFCMACDMDQIYRKERDVLSRERK